MKKVRVIYDPILRIATKSVTVFDESLKILAAEMLEIMHKNAGMGLAANQLGIDKDLLVMEYRPAKDDDKSKPIGPLMLCNAAVAKGSQSKEKFTEGCLSIPGLELPVIRPSGVTVTAQDLTGKSITIKAKGLLARILQHEIDHLDGILFTDRAEGVGNIKHYANFSIVFFGSDKFSQIVLNRLIEVGLKVTAVVTETDKPAGRGNKVNSPIIKQLANQKRIAVSQPGSKAEIVTILKQLKPDLIVLASYGKILPEEALSIPTFGALNVHPSLLPKYRGATPIQSTILAGDKATGVTIMKMNAGVDTGELVSQSKIDLLPTETFESLREKLAKVGSELLVKTLPLYLSGRAKLMTQNSSEVTATTKLTKEMGEINWEQSSVVIDRQIRALNPWPGTFTFLGNKRLKILVSSLVDGQLSLETVQLEGKKPTTWVDFVRGYGEELKKTSWFGKIHQC